MIWKRRVYSIKTVLNSENSKNSSNYFHINNLDTLQKKFDELRCNVLYGDCIVFDSKLVHKSGVNNSSSIRYAIQSRWFDSSSKDSIENFYRGGIDEGINPKEYLK